MGYSFSTFAVSHIAGCIKSGRYELDNLSRGDWADTFYRCKKMVEDHNGQTLQENPKLALEINEAMLKDWEIRLSNDPNAAVAIKLSKDPEIFGEQQKDNLYKIYVYCSENIDDYVLDNTETFDDTFSESLKNIEELKSDFNLENTFDNITLNE